jgi:hypothetical protein
MAGGARAGATTGHASLILTHYPNFFNETFGTMRVSFFGCGFLLQQIFIHQQFGIVNGCARRAANRVV